MKPNPHRTAGSARPISSLVGLLLVAVIGAACGGGGSSSSSSAPGVTKSSITIGSHQPLTGPAAPGYSEIAPAAKAMFDYVNATKGGVHGRKINYTYEDDGYNPVTTASVVNKLVLQDHVFAILNGLGTPTHEQVVQLLNAQKVPDLFVASGCVCWNDTGKHPYTTGYQTNYAIEGRILGKYIHDNFGGQKVAYLTQNDDFGQGGIAGLDKEIPSGDVASRQTYEVSGLNGGLSNQVSALQASGAKVVALFTIPAATAITLLTAAQLGYRPQWVASSVNADARTLIGLLGSFSKGAAGAALLNGMLTAGYLPSPSDTANPWITLFKKIHDTYDANNPFDANTVYGMSVGYNFVQLLDKAGSNLTRQSLIDAVNGANLSGPGVLPLTFSKSDHRGYEGEQMAKFDNGAVTAFGPVYKALELGSITIYTGGQPAPPSGF